MLTKRHIAIIGGDERYIEIINILAKQNARIDIIGFTDIAFQHNNVIKQTIDSIDFTKIDTLILPVGGTDMHGDIKLSFPVNKARITYKQIVQTPAHCTIYSGTANIFLQKLATDLNRKLVTLFDRDDIAIANSIPTAEATLQIAMENTDYTIHGANVLVCGFGRIGITTARLFHNIGANVTVSARSHAHFARIKEMRLKAIHHDALIETAHIDIFINTVPYLLFTKAVIDQMKQDAILIDLASIPGGTDFNYAREIQLSAIHALGLPGISAPKTAGVIIGETILMLLTENEI